MARIIITILFFLLPFLTCQFASDEGRRAAYAYRILEEVRLGRVTILTAAQQKQKKSALWELHSHEVKGIWEEKNKIFLTLQVLGRISKRPRYTLIG